MEEENKIEETKEDVLIKTKSEVERIIKQITENGLQTANVELLYKLIDIHKDIENENNDPYFFGTIIINCAKEDTEFGLIDGQQRTTTFMLLLKALLVRVNNTLQYMVNDSENEQIKRALRERRRNLTSILYKVSADEISDEPNDIKDKEIFDEI